MATKFHFQAAVIASRGAEQKPGFAQFFDLIWHVMMPFQVGYLFRYPEELKKVEKELYGADGWKVGSFRDSYSFEYNELFTSMLGFDVYFATCLPTIAFHMKYANVAETELSNVQWMDIATRIRSKTADMPNQCNLSTQGMDDTSIERFCKMFDVASLADLNPGAKYAALYEMLKMWKWVYTSTDEDGNKVEIFNNDPNSYILTFKMLIAARCPKMIQKSEAAEEIPSPDERLFSDTIFQVCGMYRAPAELASNTAVSLGDLHLASRLSKVHLLLPDAGPLRLYYAHLNGGCLAASYTYT
jgi:hypothetical protein